MKSGELAKQAHCVWEPNEAGGTGGGHAEDRCSSHRVAATDVTLGLSLNYLWEVCSNFKQSLSDLS